MVEALASEEEQSWSAPEDEYRRRVAEHQLEVRRWQLRERWISGLRLACVLTAVVLAWLAVQEDILSLAWALLPSLGFGVLLGIHDRVLRELGRARRGEAYYEQGLARVRDEWAGTGEGSERYLTPHHRFSADLDLFGPASLFELLSCARTRSGEDCLASWLLEPASPTEIVARQGAVKELSRRVDLREELSILGSEVRSELEPEVLESWARGESHLQSRLQRLGLAGLTAGNLTALSGWVFWGWGATPLLSLLIVQVVLGYALRHRVTAAVAGIERASRDLGLLSELLARIEAEPLSAPRLEGLRQELRAAGSSPAREIRRLRRLADLYDSRRNAFFVPFALLLVWTPQVAWAIDAWRRRFGSEIVRWLEVVGEMEALASFATYAFEHPNDVFPEVVETQTPLFEGTGLGHPLLSESTCVRNDLSLGVDHRAFVVSGSNMSGKSTLLRTTGVNVVLALAGAPVRAHRLRLSPLAIGASIRVQDSLQEGSSRFYAEIKRLRTIVALTDGELPVLFLLDEILHGTNSHDRRIGAEAVVRVLVERGAVGLVTTHDLALAKIADDSDGRLANVHLEDYLEDGKIHFDYRLREGVVEHSNALALMREVGLEV